MLVKCIWLRFSQNESGKQQHKQADTTGGDWCVLTGGTGLCIPALEQKGNIGTWKNQDILLTHLENKQNKVI